jgi:glycosyltransferase involved in cell wall biosynthesis
MPGYRVAMNRAAGRFGPAGGAAGRQSVSFVLPAFNEEANIRSAIAAVTEIGERLFADHEVVVVNDGSQDGTEELVEKAIAEDPRIRIVNHAENRGYGEALRSGFIASTMDLVFLTDADLQFDVSELERFLPWIDRVDVVAGYRINRQDPFMRRVNAKAWNVLVRALFYVPVRDIDCAFKLFRRDVFDELDLLSIGAMVNTEMMVKIARSGVSIVELGVRHYPRRAGTARGAHPRVIAKAFKELFAMYGSLHRHGVDAMPSLPPQRLHSVEREQPAVSD